VEDSHVVESVAVAEVGEATARTVNSAVKRPMDFREDTVLEVVPELEVKKVRGVLVHPTVEVDSGVVSLVMTQRGLHGGTTSATAVLVVGMEWSARVQAVGTGELPLMKLLPSKIAVLLFVCYWCAHYWSLNLFEFFWMARETEEGLKLDEKAPVPEKKVAPEDAPQAENKDNKDAAANEEEEKEEDKVYFLQDMFSEYSFFIKLWYILKLWS
jgi:hypothetical protein